MGGATENTRLFSINYDRKKSELFRPAPSPVPRAAAEPLYRGAVEVSRGLMGAAPAYQFATSMLFILPLSQCVLYLRSRRNRCEWKRGGWRRRENRNHRFVSTKGL